MRFDAITLFPDILNVVHSQGVTGRACHQNIWSMHTWNPRDFTSDKHRTIDGRPYGGGPGMVMMAEPLADAVKAAQEARASQQASYSASRITSSSCAPVILFSPVGPVFNQDRAQALAQTEGAILICGRYEGVDQRFIDTVVTEEISIGDFVLSGGEIAAMAVIDATVRCLPGVLNDRESFLQDSFHFTLSGLLDSPHYTRPEVYENTKVPEVLLSGHHKNIAGWRRERSLLLTAKNRPDLINHARQKGWLTMDDEKILSQTKESN